MYLCLQFVSVLMINCAKNILNLNLPLNVRTNGVGIYKTMKIAFGSYGYLYSELKQADDFLLFLHAESSSCRRSYNTVILCPWDTKVMCLFCIISLQISSKLLLAFFSVQYCAYETLKLRTLAVSY
jgi:hypothetical protein